MSTNLTSRIINGMATHTHTKREQEEGGGEGGGGRGAGGREGFVGAGVLDSENNGRIRWQHSLIGRLSRARPTEGSEECAWELYLASNHSSRAPSTHTVRRSSCKISKPKKARRRREQW